jgi:hypothetical protein
MDRQVLEQSLADEAQLNVTFVGRQLAAEVFAVGFGLAMRVLRTIAAPDRVHVLHPEMVGVSADRVNGLLETDFDFEAPAVQANNFQRV